MELIYHLGIIPKNDLTLMRFFLGVRGLFVMYILFISLVIYHVVSVTCSSFCYFFPESTNNIKRASAASFWDLCLYFLGLNRIQFNITGDDIDSESAVVISNHQSLADHIVMAQLARYSNSHTQVKTAKNTKYDNLTLPRINFFSWFLIWKVPKLRILANLAKCDENWELDKSLSEVFFERLFKSKIPEWIVLFPEVNIWTEEDSILQKKQSEKFYLPIMQNVLYPRFSGFYNVVSSIKAKNNFKFTKLYDVTLSYDRGLSKLEQVDNKMSPNPKQFSPPTLLEIFASEDPITVTIHIKTKSFSRIPTKRSKLERWLEHTWVDKDKLLDEIREVNPKIEATMTSISSPVPASASILRSPLNKPTGTEY